MTKENATIRAEQAISLLLEAATVAEMNAAVDNAKALATEKAGIDYGTLTRLVHAVRTVEAAL